MSFNAFFFRLVPLNKRPVLRPIGVFRSGCRERSCDLLQWLKSVYPLIVKQQHLGQARELFKDTEIQIEEEDFK